MGDVHYKAGMALVIPKGVKHQNKNTGSKDAFVVSMFNPALR
jgi:quercetin dioxygenase-like cupin family protein